MARLKDLRRIEPGTPVRVVWRDAHSADEWVCAEHLAQVDYPEVVVVSFGFWHGLGAGQVAIYRSASNWGQLEGFLFIPSRWVETVDILTIAEGET